MDEREQGELQSEGHGVSVHSPGVPQVVDGDLRGIGQCGDVEHKVGELGSPVFGTAILSPHLLSGELVEGRASDPKERSSLR